jgi:MFS family permease
MNKNLSRSIYVVYIIGFLFALRDAIPTYVASSFLSTFSNEAVVGLIYTFAAVISLICFSVIPLFLREKGNYKTTLVIASIDLLSIIGLISFKDPALLVMLFVINLVSITLLAFTTDIFLEAKSSDSSTGQIRGIYLTSINLAWMLSPILSALLLTDNEYWKIYAVSAIPLLVLIAVTYYKLKNFVDPVYSEPSLLKTVKEVWNNKNLRPIYLMNFTIQFFYAWMIIYTPIYLHNHIGLDWTVIGIIFIIMLSPFVILDYPLGRLADKKWGEKEMLIIGILITAIATGAITFTNTKSVLVWALMLFLTRVGAATVEVMSEVYFFKNIEGKNANLVSGYRSMRPLAYIFAPALATVFLAYFDIHYIFIALGLIVFYSICFAAKLKDTL